MVPIPFSEIFNPLPLSLPAHITLTLLFSYLVWSKFLKKDELKIGNVRDLLDILSISMMVFVFLSSTYLIQSVFSYRNDVQYAYNNVPETVVNTYITLLALLVFLLIYARDLELNRDDLHIVAFTTTCFFTAMFIFTSGFHSIVYKTDTESIFLGRISRLYSFYFNIPLIYLFALLSGFFRAGDSKRSYGTFDPTPIKRIIHYFSKHEKMLKTLAIVLLLSFPIGLIVGYLMIPTISVSESPPFSYELRGERYNGSADELVSRSYRIEKYGHLLDLISLNYSGLSFQETPYYFSLNRSYIASNSCIYPYYSYPIDIIDRQQNMKECGIEDFFLENQTNSVIVKLNKEKFKNSNVSIFIKGKRERNISKDFVIEAPIECLGRNCTVDIKFVNKLEQPIHANDVWLLNPATYSYGRCHVSNASGTIKKDDIPIRFEFRRSDVDYRFQAFPLGFFMFIRGNMLNGLYVDGFSIEGKTEVDLRLTLLCE